MLGIPCASSRGLLAHTTNKSTSVTTFNLSCAKPCALLISPASESLLDNVSLPPNVMNKASLGVTTGLVVPVTKSCFKLSAYTLATLSGVSAM